MSLRTSSRASTRRGRRAGLPLW